MQPTKHFNRYQFLKEPIVQPKKLTFEEYIIQKFFSCWETKPTLEQIEYNLTPHFLKHLRNAWDAAQENK